jgi:hypothetical protein
LWDFDDKNPGMSESEARQSDKMLNSHSMKNEYSIEPDGSEFIVVDPGGATIGVYPTEDAANEDIERAKKNDAMWNNAKLLVGIAIKAHMRTFGVDRETARYWILSAADAG